MGVTTLLLLISISIFAAYNIYILTIFGIPDNISITYYYLENRQHKSGLLFPLMMSLSCITIFPTWIYIGSILPLSIVWYNILIYIAAFSTIMVAVLANYKKSMWHTLLHYIAAIVAAISALLWIVFTNCNLLYIPLIVVGLVSLAAILTNSVTRNFFYWLEITTIYSVQIVLFILSITTKSGF